MILKASQRSGGQALAIHLMRTDENEHVRVHGMRGFVAEDLRGAFKEIEAVARGTKCRQYLFSLSLSPPETENVPADVFEQVIERIEQRLGLIGQPRAIVFHEKEGRRHAHCVWSRIDVDTMTARQLSFFKRKLMNISRDLYLENEWKMPRGMANSVERNPSNFSLAEWQQAKRQGVDPRWLKQTLQDCWARSDDAGAFGRSLEEYGFFLAKGDRRAFVVVDHSGEVHSLPRALAVKTTEVQARLGNGDHLPTVSDTQRLIGARMSAAMRRHVDEAREKFRIRAAALGSRKMEMVVSHRTARKKLDEHLEIEWIAETRARAARLPTGLRGIWSRLTGRYQDIRRENEANATVSRVRHEQHRQQLIGEQLAQRRIVQADLNRLRKQHADELLDLRRDIGHFLRYRASGGSSESTPRLRQRKPFE